MGQKLQSIIFFNVMSQLFYFSLILLISGEAKSYKKDNEAITRVLLLKVWLSA